MDSFADLLPMLGATLNLDFLMNFNSEKTFNLPPRYLSAVICAFCILDLSYKTDPEKRFKSSLLKKLNFPSSTRETAKIE